MEGGNLKGEMTPVAGHKKSGGTEPAVTTLQRPHRQGWRTLRHGAECKFPHIT